MNTLKVKILGVVCSIVVLIVAVASYVNFNSQNDLIQNITERNTLLLTETIKNSIADVMKSGHSDEVRIILARIKAQEFIKSIRIYDPNGKILNSADASEIGGVISSNALESHKKGQGLSSHENGIYSSISLIRNSPACHGCHSPSKEILGIIQVDVSLKYLNSFIAAIKQNSIITALIITLLISVTICSFLILYVDKPIKNLINLMLNVEKGDFDCKSTITSSREMKLLSDNFNHMVEKLKQVMNTAISHERELALAQGKLAHHKEIHTMNQKLEAQIKEIEILNITLEERIEEIEEANYKIADMAGELEDKNTNLEKAVARLSTLYKVGLAMNSTMDPDKLFNMVVNTTVATLNAQIGYIILYDHANNRLKVSTIIGHNDLPKGDVFIPMKASSVSSWVITNRKPLLIADIDETPQFDRFSALGYERKTLICAPLIVKDEIIGTITVVNKNDKSVYTNEELELLTTISTQASIAINNAQLYDEQQKTYMNTIHALVSAIEASDSYTRGHSERVTRYCLSIGEKLGLTQDRLKIIERAAILHDIGKIGIDLTLLHKKDRLTSEDIVDLQQHPNIGMMILEPIEFLGDVRLCIGQHHERFDGRGYPNSITAESLLLESRILAIADSFDAMTSDRPYRKAMPMDIAINELQAHSGTQFDPMIVPIFVDMIESGQFSLNTELNAEQFNKLLVVAQ